MSHHNHHGRYTLRAALLAGLSGALLVALLPAAMILDRRLSAELERRARDDLLRAPMVLDDRNAARAETLGMHAEVVAAAPGLGSALMEGDHDAALAIAGAAAADFPGEELVLLDGDGGVWTGPAAAGALLAPGTNAPPPVTFVRHPDGPRAVALALVPGAPGAAAGVAAPLDATAAATLAALTRADVVILNPEGGLAAANADTVLASAVARLATGWGSDPIVHEVVLAAGAHWIVVAPLGGAGGVAFLRSVEEELAVIPGIRRAAVGAAVVALLLAIAAGSLYALRLARPVRSLAAAAGRLADGDFAAPLPASSIVEVAQVAAAFGSMRAALAARLEELAHANRTLEERQERLTALQAELMQQDRLAASGRLVAELAHEIRNPVANVRNCIELVRRRVQSDPEALAFADMAVEELLRMHRLAEQLLDLHRPSEDADPVCDAAALLRELAALARTEAESAGPRLLVEAPAELAVAMPRDGLRQVLVNLVENAREAAGPSGLVELRAGVRDGVARLEVLDSGAGIPEDVLPRMFDPFFTTKGAVSGVGLGLFVAEGIARRFGGRVRADNRPAGGGRLVVELRLAGSQIPA